MVFMRTPHTSPAEPSDDCSQNFLQTWPLGGVLSNQYCRAG